MNVKALPRRDSRNKGYFVLIEDSVEEEAKDGKKGPALHSSASRASRALLRAYSLFAASPYSATASSSIFYAILPFHMTELSSFSGFHIPIAIEDTRKLRALTLCLGHA